MKRWFALWLICLGCLGLATACKNHYLRGYYSRAEFLDSCRWQHPVDTRYRAQAQWMDSLRSIPHDSAEVILFLGTWCSDSRKLVPKFLALQDSLPIRQLQIVAVDTTKRDSMGLHQLYRVDSVPTFIFFRAEREVGRLRVKPPKRKGQSRNLERELYYILRNP
jgi:thiol-disulfide isomerase/thioredoxin